MVQACPGGLLGKLVPPIAQKGMVDVSERRKCSCGKCTPSFGMPGGSATHCKECKEQGMVDVRNRRCSCGRCAPSFGMLGGSATHCKECKDEGMVNIRSTSRIINAHGVFWLRLMENFAEHQEPFRHRRKIAALSVSVCLCLSLSVSVCL